MGERKKIVIPKKYIAQYGKVNTIWSYSKVTSLDNCPWEYYLGRILKKQGSENIYAVCGSIAHDILEDLYNGKIKYEDMKDRFDKEFIVVEISDFHFYSDPAKDLKAKKKYKECILNFFENHIPVKTKVINEQEIWIDVCGNIFIGYVDAIHKDEEGCYVITDYKTSSMTEYVGKKKEIKAKQLQLYGLGLLQMGVPIDKIKLRWNFLKYVQVNIKYKLKSGTEKEKSMIGERIAWVDKVKTQLKKDIIQFYECDDIEATIKLNECITNNNLDTLDKEISKNYTLSDAYVYADLTEEEVTNLEVFLLERIKQIESKGKKEELWNIEPFAEPSFYCNVLCGHKKHCKYYKEAMEKKEEVVKYEEDVLKELMDIL